ncbi:prolyl hydroxylase family protein [uncultured Sphingomonas sp.]|uniref:prolyl hydroxylase family protein n=1 Tax=uncultured Sphingomonas sp. TaxID=158754 RepID=UPI0035CC0712
MSADSSIVPLPESGPGSGFPPEPVIARLTAAPGVQRTPTARLTLFQRRAFLDGATCAALIDRIEAQRRPSEVANFNGDAQFRTSETCDLGADDPVVAAVDGLIADFIGLDPAHGEPMQGQRYAVGQQFKGHTDYFDPTGVDYEKYTSAAGNRTWTVMIYLNAPPAGGATRFKAIDKIVQPEAGKLLAWNNLRPDGSVNPSTLHQGMQVRAGVKYVITKWFRQRPWQTLTMPHPELLVAPHAFRI